MEFLRRRVGQTIDRVLLQRWREDAALLNVYLWFAEGNPICLGCSGDGGIYSLSSQPPSASSEVVLEPFAALDGATLRKVLQGAETLDLDTDRGQLSLLNSDDHLVLRIRPTPAT